MKITILIECRIFGFFMFVEDVPLIEQCSYGDYFLFKQLPYDFYKEEFILFIFYPVLPDMLR